MKEDFLKESVKLDAQAYAAFKQQLSQEQLKISEVMLYINSEKCLKAIPTGSRFVCNPPVYDTDIDIVLYVINKDEMALDMEVRGWDYCGGYEGVGSTFLAMRKGSYNIILVDDFEEYKLWVDYTLVASALNLQDKSQRTLLAQLIRHNSEFDVKLGFKSPENLDQALYDPVNPFLSCLSYEFPLPYAPFCKNWKYWGYKND